MNTTSLDESPRLSHGVNHQALIHVNFEQTKIASAVNQLLGGRRHTVQFGESVQDLAHALGTYAPPSLFRVEVGQQWQFDGQSMRNILTSTSFPAQAANDDQFTIAANK